MAGRPGRAANRAKGLSAADVMTTEPVAAREDDSVRDAASRMLQRGVGALPVLSVSGAPIGMVSDGDLLGHRQRDPRREWWLDVLASGSVRRDAPRFIADRRVREVMSAPLITIAPSTLVHEIAELMVRHGVKRLPVIEEGRLAGIVSRSDLVGVFQAIARPPAATPRANALLEFLESMIGGASLRGRTPPVQGSTPAQTHDGPAAYSAQALREARARYGKEKVEHALAERDAARLRRQRDVKALLQAHIDEALWRDLIEHSESAAANGETEMLMLAFPCALCADGGRGIDVAEPGWEATLRGEAAELYARWRRELEPLGFGAQARIIDYDEQGVIAEAGLFLTWGA